jgi:hypothetical protein
MIGAMGHKNSPSVANLRAFRIRAGRVYPKTPTECYENVDAENRFPTPTARAGPAAVCRRALNSFAAAGAISRMKCRLPASDQRTAIERGDCLTKRFRRGGRHLPIDAT